MTSTISETGTGEQHQRYYSTKEMNSSSAENTVQHPPELPPTLPTPVLLQQETLGMRMVGQAQPQQHQQWNNKSERSEQQSVLGSGELQQVKLSTVPENVKNQTREKIQWQ